MTGQGGGWATGPRLVPGDPGARIQAIHTQGRVPETKKPAAKGPGDADRGKSVPRQRIQRGELESEPILAAGSGLFPCGRGLGVVLLATQVGCAAATFFVFVVLLAHSFLYCGNDFCFAMKMRLRPGCINLFFGLFLWLGLGVGCATGDEGGKTPAERDAANPDKQASTIRLHKETRSIGMGTGKIQVIRSSPVTLNIEKGHFVDEGFVEDARVLDGMGGPRILVKFNSRGALRLQSATVSGQGSRIAIWSKWTEGRWLAAPQVMKPIEDGVLVFTIDGTREEAERIVRGLNNVAVELENKPKPDKKAEQAARKARQKNAKNAAKVARDSENGAKSDEEMFLK